MQPLCRSIDNEEGVVSNQPEAVHHLDGEVVDSCNRSEVRLDEGVPARVSFAFRRWFESVRKQHVTACW